MMVMAELPSGLTVKPLTEHQAEALDVLYRAVLACNSVERWSSGFEQDHQPYHYTERALVAALSDLYGTAHAGAILAEVHNTGEPPSHIVRLYFGTE